MTRTTHQPKKIGILVENHFDPGEFRDYNEYLPAQGYEVEYLSHLRGNKQLTFASNPTEGAVEEKVSVSTEVDSVQPSDYAGIILIGGYAMNRLRYQESITLGQPNRAPAVQFLREALVTPRLKIGTICHSLWLFCADPSLLEGRRVTCAHNIVCDVESAGGIVQYEGGQTVDLVVDDNIICGKHSDMARQFMERFLTEIEAADRRSPAGALL